ncbi:RsiV family protein [Pseudomonas huanghezhanensis]|uniref:RsiV family protein n=1 Tax=Pseudomonas huanghezhanensis TaxID=3002903 RepID=UPI0038B5FE75
MEWITTGVGDGSLDSFLLTQTGLTFLFSPYEVGPYALGSFSAHVPFDRFTSGALRNDFVPTLSHEPDS